MEVGAETQKENKSIFEKTSLRNTHNPEKGKARDSLKQM